MFVSEPAIVSTMSPTWVRFLHWPPTVMAAVIPSVASLEEAVPAHEVHPVVRTVGADLPLVIGAKPGEDGGDRDFEDLESCGGGDRRAPLVVGANREPVGHTPVEVAGQKVPHPPLNGRPGRLCTGHCVDNS